MKYLTIIWQDIRTGQNLDIYITITLSIVVGILGVFGIVNQTIISGAVLATLALVSAIMLQNRRENDSLQNAILQIRNASELSEPFLQHELLSSYSVQNQLLSTARKVFFWGLTFERMTPHVRDTLERRLQSGLEVRFLIIKPNSSAVKMAAFRSPYQGENRINIMLDTILLDLNTIAQNATPPAKLEVRVTDYLPAWTIMAFDPHLPNGQMFVSLLTFRTPGENRPSFKLNSKDSEWFHIFTEQFEALWKEAEAVSLSESKGK